MWNHPWVLKLDEDRQLERAERAAMYGLSDSEPEDCEGQGREKEFVCVCVCVTKINCLA